MSEELKSCPFCGSSARLVETLGTERHSDLFSVVCNDDMETFCTTSGKVFSGGNMYMMPKFDSVQYLKSEDARQDAIEAWNTRAEPKPPSADVQEALRVINEFQQKFNKYDPLDNELMGVFETIKTALERMGAE